MFDWIVLDRWFCEILCDQFIAKMIGYACHRHEIIVVFKYVAFLVRILCISAHVYHANFS